MAGKTGRQQQNQKNQPAADSMPPAPAVAPFLLKTHQMVEDPATDYVISWTPTGASFVVSNIEELARKILPTHFKHNNFSSFVRQLNTYGFRKVSSERWEFTNDHFLRAEPDLLTKIVRRKPSATPKTQAQPNATDGGGLSPPASTSKDEDQSSSSTTSLTPIPPQDQYLPHDQQQVLLQDNEKLKRENQILSAQLEDARRMCQMYQGFLERHINVSKLNANSSQVVAPNIVEKVEETHEEEQVKRGASTEFKLFGVCLKEFAQETNNNNKRKRFCNQDIDSIIERPPKMAGFWAL